MSFGEKEDVQRVSVHQALESVVFVGGKATDVLKEGS